MSDRMRSLAARLGRLAPVGLALGLAILAGHPQSAMYILYASLAYALFRTWRVRPRRRVVAGLGVFVLVGLGLSAAQWLPSLEYTLLSSRAGMTYQDLSGGLPLIELRHMLLVNRSPVYAGLLPLLLALMAIWLHRSRAVQFWAGLRFYRGTWGALKHRTADMNTLIAVGMKCWLLSKVN